MATTFKVGDKVEHRTFGAGEIAFGPFEHYQGGNRFLMKEASGRHALVEGSSLTRAAKFKAGDRVRVYSDGGFTVKAGPFVGARHDWYVVTDPAGIDYRSGVAALTRDETDTYVCDGVTYDLTAKYRDNRGWLWSFTGKRIGGVPTMTISGNVDNTDTVNFLARTSGPLTRVDEADVHTHAGVTYDLSARYRDKEGDFWTFRLVGDTVRGTYSSYDRDVSDDINEYSDTLATAVSVYGPLTRVND